MDIQSNLSSGTSSIEEIAKFAEQLGFSSIVICDAWESPQKLQELKEKIAEVQKLVKVEIIPGVKIEAGTISELKRSIEQAREKAVIIAVAGGDYEINRAACEDSRVDFLAHPEFNRRDNGLDEVCLHAASKNDVAIEVNFRELLSTYKRTRTYNLEKIATNIRLCQNLGVKIVASSGAQSAWEMRDPRELVSIVNILGVELGSSFATVSDIPNAIIDKNKRKLGGKVIADGVEVVEAKDNMTAPQSGAQVDYVHRAVDSSQPAAKNNMSGTNFTKPKEGDQNA